MRCLSVESTSRVLTFQPRWKQPISRALTHSPKCTHAHKTSLCYALCVVPCVEKHTFHPRNCLHDSAPARPQRERQTPTRSHTRGGDLGCFNLASWLPQQTMSVLLRYLQKARKGTTSCQRNMRLFDVCSNPHILALVVLVALVVCSTSCTSSL